MLIRTSLFFSPLSLCISFLLFLSSSLPSKAYNETTFVFIYQPQVFQPLQSAIKPLFTFAAALLATTAL